MAGIYLHIPFCRKACVYCDFHFSTRLSLKNQFLDALEKEIELRNEELRDLNPLRSIYFGGGTPSVLSGEELGRLLVTIRNQIDLPDELEISLEANPEDLTPEYLKSLRGQGINRLSVGLQSFSGATLKWMNRSHTLEQSLGAIQDLRESGFDNFSVDLIFGNPGTDLSFWKNEIKKLLRLEPPHISIYALTPEAKTVLSHQLKSEQIYLPTDQIFQEQFLFAHEALSSAGYEHYELSNYSLPGFRSVHNSAYWEAEPYVGFGPSAHSFDGRKRSWNVANNPGYIAQLEEGNLPQEAQEILSPRDMYHEYIMTHLRKESGIDVDHIEKKWIKDWKSHFAKEIEKLMDQKLVKKQDNRLYLSPEGWFMSDQIIRDLFIDELF